MAPGAYDAKLKDVSGRTCVVRGVKVEAGAIFSIEERADLLHTLIPLGISAPRLNC